MVSTSSTTWFVTNPFDMVSRALQDGTLIYVFPVGPLLTSVDFFRNCTFPIFFSNRHCSHQFHCSLLTFWQAFFDDFFFGQHYCLPPTFLRWIILFNANVILVSNVYCWCFRGEYCLLSTFFATTIYRRLFLVRWVSFSLSFSSRCYCSSPAVFWLVSFFFFRQAVFGQRQPPLISPCCVMTIFALGQPPSFWPILRNLTHDMNLLTSEGMLKIWF